MSESKEEVAVKRAFGERLKRRREKKYKGLTAKEFYELLEHKAAQRGFRLPFGLTTYRNYENGERTPSLYSLALLAHALDTSLDYLVGIYDKTSLIDILNSQGFVARIQDKDIHVTIEDLTVKLKDKTVRQIYTQAWKQVRENTETILRDALTEQYKQSLAAGHNDGDEIISRSICHFMGIDYEQFFDALTKAMLNEELLLPACFKTSSNALCFYYITGINPAESPLRARQLLELYALIDSSRLDNPFDHIPDSILETAVQNYTDKRQAVLIELYDRIYKSSYAWKPAIPFLNRYIIRYADIPLWQQLKKNNYKRYFLNMLIRLGNYPGPLNTKKAEESEEEYSFNEYVMSAIITDFENKKLFRSISSNETKIKLLNELRFQLPGNVIISDLKKQYEKFKASFSKNHAETVSAFYKLTRAMIEYQDYDAAIELAKSEYGEHSECIAEVFQAAAVECYDENYTKKGIGYAKTALSYLEKNNPEDVRLLIQFQDTLALLYSDTKEDWPKAKAIAERQLKEIKDIFPDDKDLLGYEYYVLATIYFIGDEYESEALSAAEKSYELLSVIPESDRTPEIQKRIKNSSILLSNIRKWFEENADTDLEMD